MNDIVQNISDTLSYIIKKGDIKRKRKVRKEKKN